MKLSLGFSPCPNDTFIFDALVHQKVDTEGLEFELFLEDVEALNQRAFAGELDITKLSYHAYAHLIDKYVLLNAGSALGKNCGPLLIAKKKLTQSQIEQGRIAIPGKYTTANFLLSLAYPNAANKDEMLFSDIESAVLNDEVDAGLIIHENRFTYESRGLIKQIDLGEFWESSTQLPIPLGGIVVSRRLPLEVQMKFDRVLTRSVGYALEQPEQTLSYVSNYAQEMEPKVMMQHIQLYVNHFTKALGEEGKSAVRALFKMANDRLDIPLANAEIFLPEVRF